MQQINWLAEFLLLGLLALVPILIIIDIIDHQVIVYMLDEQVFTGILILPFAYIFGIVMHVLARRIFVGHESATKQRLFFHYRKSLDPLLNRYLSGRIDNNIDAEVLDIRETFRKMRTFLAAHMHPTYQRLDDRRAILRAARGAIFPFLFLAVVSLAWGWIKGISFGYFFSILCFVMAFCCYQAFLVRSEDWDRHCITLFIASQSIAKEKLCDDKTQ